MERRSSLPRRVREHLRRNVYGLLALFVALSGSAYATQIAHKNTVTSKSIRNGQVKAVDIRGNAINSGKVADNSLTAADVSGLNGADVSGLTGANIEDQSITAADIDGPLAFSCRAAPTNFNLILGPHGQCVYFRTGGVTKNWRDTIADCAFYHMRLPSPAEAFDAFKSVAGSATAWTSSPYSDTDTFTVTGGATPALAHDTATNLHNIACIEFAN